MFDPGWFSQERAAIQKELQRLQKEHETLRRNPGKPFDWEGHNRHFQSLEEMSKRLRVFRERMMA